MNSEMFTIISGIVTLVAGAAALSCVKPWPSAASGIRKWRLTMPLQEASWKAIAIFSVAATCATALVICWATRPESHRYRIEKVTRANGYMSVWKIDQETGEASYVVPAVANEAEK